MQGKLNAVRVAGIVIIVVNLIAVIVLRRLPAGKQWVQGNKMVCAPWLPRESLLKA